MGKCILTIIFLVVTAGNSLAAVTPHLEGDTGCSMDCCHKGQKPVSESMASAICCKLDCEQPGGVPATPASITTTTTQDKLTYDLRAVGTPEPILYVQRVRFPASPTRSLTGSSTRFLEFGAFLI